MEEQNQQSQAPNNSSPQAPAAAAGSGEASKSRIRKIHVDRDLCIGASSCVAVTPGVFQLDSEGKAYVVSPEGGDDDSIILAAESCPVKAILLQGQDDKQIYP